jgi:hypothetical protein
VSGMLYNMSIQIAWRERMETFKTDLYETTVAVDFLSSFLDQESFSFLRRAVENAITDDYLEYDVAVEAVVALELIAAIKGNANDALPLFEEISENELINKYESKISNYLMTLCQDALSILRRDEDSGVFDEYGEYAEFDDWIELLDDIEERLF